LPQIKIKKSERKLQREDYELIMENVGIKIPRSSKKSKEKSTGEKRSKNVKGFRDDEGDVWNSEDEDFVASSSEEDEDEISAGTVLTQIKKYVEKSGVKGARARFRG